MRRFLHENGLTLALLFAFLLCLGGQLATGWQVQNQDLAMHGRAAEPLSAYVTSGPFLSSVFENWESEFLQMSAYVLLTAMLFQRGSAESRDPDKFPRQGDDLGRAAHDLDAPWPLRAGPVVSYIYSHSLGLALALLFVVSFVMHWLNSARASIEQAQLHGEAVSGSMLSHLGDAQLWFESFQNWQSEFLSTAVLVVLSIVLRQQGSPESKPVGAPTAQTGG